MSETGVRMYMKLSHVKFRDKALLPVGSDGTVERPQEFDYHPESGLGMYDLESDSTGVWVTHRQTGRKAFVPMANVASHIPSGPAHARLIAAYEDFELKHGRMPAEGGAPRPVVVAEAKR